MKKIFFLALVTIFFGCDSENAIDCLQTTGNSVEKEFDLPNFEEIMIYDRVKLFVTHGDSQKVIVKTGKNLLPDVQLSVRENRLSVRNNNACNLVRDYRTVEVYVVSPNLTYIQNGSQWSIESTNLLPYPDLKLVSENYGEEGQYHTDGNFILQLDCENLRIVNNNFSSYFLSGNVNTMFAGFYSGDGRLEAYDLNVEHIEIFQRSSNSFYINPQQSLRGEIRGTGDVYSKTRPPIVEVEEFYTGKLIFMEP